MKWKGIRQGRYMYSSADKGRRWVWRLRITIGHIFAVHGPFFCVCSRTQMIQKITRIRMRWSGLYESAWTERRHEKRVGAENWFPFVNLGIWCHKYHGGERKLQIYVLLLHCVSFRSWQRRFIIKIPNQYVCSIFMCLGVGQPKSIIINRPDINIRESSPLIIKYGANFCRILIDYR